MGSDRIPDELPWRAHAPDRLIGPGHTAGDFLEAHDWEVLEEAPGRLRIAAHVPDRVRNPRGQLFGGFTGTYVDLAALFTMRTTQATEGRRKWMTTVRMDLQYLAPVVEDRIEIASEVTAQRGRNAWVTTRLLDTAGEPLALAITVLRTIE